MSDNDSVLNDLLEKQSYVIAFLPRQVPKAADGQFFKIENYLLNNYTAEGIRKGYRKSFAFRYIVKREGGEPTPPFDIQSTGRLSISS